MQVRSPSLLTSVSELNDPLVYRKDRLLKTLVSTSIVVLAFGLTACNEPEVVSDADLPTIGSPSDLTAFQGARAGQAEFGIQRLGFQLARSEGLTNYWFNPATGACAKITTDQGRYSEVEMVAGGDC